MSKSFERDTVDQDLGAWMLEIDQLIGEYRSYAVRSRHEEWCLARLMCARDDLASVLNVRGDIRTSPKPSPAGGIR